MTFHRYSARLLRVWCAALAALIALPCAAVDMEYVIVSDPGNGADPNNLYNIPDLGSVLYAYRIGKYEVTNAQYAEFLNAVAASDPYALYDGRMANNGTYGGITQSGTSGSFTYQVKPGFANKPVVFVTFFDAVRFANWLHNGQGSGDTENGAYTLVPRPGYPPEPDNSGTLARNANAAVFLPNENEWYKAAYFQGDGTYRKYPTRSNTAPTAEPPPGGSNSANFNGAGGVLTDVGAYTQASARYGTYDQGGNAHEWLETPNGGFRLLRGGHFANGVESLESYNRGYWYPTDTYENMGFRVAASLPPPDVPPSARATWRILPLGDSITQASLPQKSFRYNLWIKLIDAGVDFDFVGSLTDNAGSGGNDPANWPQYQGHVFDQNHEGHSGKRADEILAGLTGSPGWMLGYTPDIVLMHVGSNDALQGRSAGETEAALGGIIDVLRAKNPNVIILLAKIIPTSDANANVKIDTINALIPGVATQKHTAASPVLVVNQHDGFDLATDSYDGIHPNTSGEEKIAKKFFEALQIYTLKSNPGVDPEGHLTVGFLRIKSPSRLTYTVEVSGNLQQWFSGPDETEEVGTPVDHFNGTESAVVRDKKSPATDGHRFIRLRLNY
jgi:lysophospholipase L1-like esterase